MSEPISPKPPPRLEPRSSVVDSAVGGVLSDRRESKGDGVGATGFARGGPTLQEESVRMVRRFFLEHSREGVYKQILELVERPLIELVLTETNGNQKLAARRLSINRNTLHSRIKKLGIDPGQFRSSARSRVRS